MKHIVVSSAGLGRWAFGAVALSLMLIVLIVGGTMYGLGSLLLLAGARARGDCRE